MKSTPLKENSDWLVQVEEILSLIRIREKTISEIAESLGIPKATAYRKVNRLIELGWIKETSEKRGIDGKKYLAVVRIQRASE